MPKLSPIKVKPLVFRLENHFYAKSAIGHFAYGWDSTGTEVVAMFYNAYESHKIGNYTSHKIGSYSSCELAEEACQNYYASIVYDLVELA